MQHTADRLISESLDRHDAIRAVGSILAEKMLDIPHDPVPGSNLNEPYLAALAQITADGWRG